MRACVPACRRPAVRRSRGWSARPRSALPHLAAHVLALVADALALVRLGGAHLADLRRGLADLLLVDALDHDLRVRRNLEGDPLWGLHHDRMRITNVEPEIGALQC